MEIWSRGPEKNIQRELFYSEVNKRETIAAIEANNDKYCLQKQIEKFPLGCLLKIVEGCGLFSFVHLPPR